MNDNNDQSIEPIELTPESCFNFQCHPGLSCFTECCGNTTIMLSPYDILRLKRHLGLSSRDFLTQYTCLVVDEESNLPLIILNMQQGPENRCPFLKAEGCSVYEHRPTACRYYPIGLGSMLTESGLQECHAYIREEHCQGFNSDTPWQVDTWRRNQGLEEYDEMNREWKVILLSLSARPHGKMDANQQDQFFMAAYDLDRFRSLLAHSPLGKKCHLDPEKAEALQSNDAELLKIAYGYLKTVLGREAQSSSACTVECGQCPGDQ